MAKKLRGRPQKAIDKTQFEKLCALQCTQDEIASYFDVSHDTILRWCKRTYGATFEDVYKDKRQAGMISLRRSQWKLGQTDVKMAIWLGKQYLGQADKKEIKNEVHATGELDAVLEQLKEK